MALLVLNPAQVRKQSIEPARKLVKKVIDDTKLLARLQVPKKTGRMATQFRSTVVTNGYTVTGLLENYAEQALWIHEGTPPHREPIYRPGPMHFYWEKKGKWVTFAKVHHPGIKPIRYLTDPLKLIGRENGFRVDINHLGPS